MFYPLNPSSLRLKIGYGFLIISLSSLFWTQAFAQGSTAGAWIPVGIEPGSPAGSYSLSGFEQINNFNGSMDVTLPLIKVGGRGDAGYTIPLRITPDPWTIESGMVYGDPDVLWTHYASPSWWSVVKVGYGPGVMNVRKSGKDVYEQGGSYYFNRTLTKLAFTTPDGTEYEFVDQASEGAINGGRGREWTTRDGGMSATFIADSYYTDLVNYYGGQTETISATGDLYMKNGVRYRIVDGLVIWMRDRNGNRVSFTYDSTKRITKAVDSLNREVTFQYSVYDSSYGICDKILWKGAGGESRVIRISRTNLSNCLRPDQALKTYAQLFPQLSGSGNAYYNPNDKVSSIWLPDGRSYQIRYNGNGEVARVELPTGGAMEYDYSAGDASLPASGVTGAYWQIYADPTNPNPPRLGIYRRLRERRIYEGSTLEGKTLYDLPIVTGLPPSNITTVIVRNQDTSGTQLTAEKH